MALTPRQHDALAAYVVTSDRSAAARSINISPFTLRTHLAAVFERSGEAQSALSALWNRGWITIPARPSVCVPGGLAWVEPGGRDFADPTDEGPA